ncbi:calcium/sodium antiporter [Rhodosalinus sp. K401]|uniref:calcium/sodium antiporter n=1 Tax=Rhodosalinus sp. K401 TaxID=3239195 RepID=UPI00352613A1
MTWLLLASGLVLLLAGGEALVRGAVLAATRLGVSPLVIGLTLVGFGTSTPELVASLQAAAAGAPGLALGNVVGSNIANVLLILGLAAVIAPVAVSRGAFLRDGAAVVGASLALAALALHGTVGRLAGAALLVALALYTLNTLRSERTGWQEVATEEDTPQGRLWRGLGLAALGIAGVVVGAEFLVRSALVLARGFGVSETVIGLTLVAVGTSLPELATSVVAALRRQSALALGNVLGSNLFNILGIAGVTAMVTPLPVPPEIAGRDVWVMLAAALALAAAGVTGWRIDRREGAAFLAAYAGVMALQLGLV